MVQHKIQYRCKACGQYSKHFEDKRYLKSFCLQKNVYTALIRVNKEKQQPNGN